MEHQLARVWGSVLDLLELWLDNVTHLGTWLAWLEGSEESIWSWDGQIWGHVGVWSGQHVGFASSGGKLSLQKFSLVSLLGLLLSSLVVAKDALPFSLTVISRWHPLVKIL